MTKNPIDISDYSYIIFDIEEDTNIENIDIVHTTANFGVISEDDVLSNTLKQDNYVRPEILTQVTYDIREKIYIFSWGHAMEEK